MTFFDNCRREMAQLAVPESVGTIEMITDFFQDGAMWTRDTYLAPNGARCLAAAANAVRVSNIDSAKYWLVQAIKEREPQLGTIEQFNDSRRSYDEVAAVLRRARELAEQSLLPAPRPVAALPAPVAGEILPPVGLAAPGSRAFRDVTPAARVGRYRPGLTAGAAVATAAILAAFLNE
jgi:hypothetical protein